MKHIWYIVLFVLALYIPVWILTYNKFFVLSTDFDASLAMYSFFVDFVNTHGAFPTWIPFVGTGIPVIGDPTSVVLNPILTPLLLMFGVENGVRSAILVLYFLSGVSMWLLLRSLDIHGWLRLWGSCMYVVSGLMVANIRAGHIPEMLTYPVFPLVFLVLLKRTLHLQDSVAFALLSTYMFFSGYMYALWFIAICAVVIVLYRSISSPRTDLFKLLYSYVAVLLLFVVFSFPKLYSMATEVAGSIERFFNIDPYKGSIHAIWYPLGFVVPFQISFYDRPFFQRLFGFYYNWYEYYAFITPLPFLFLTSLKRVIQNPVVKILLILLVTGALYIALKYPYSPFYWVYKLFPFAHTFRVPQRIYSATTTIVIALIVLCARAWFSNASTRKKRLGIIVCAVSLLWTFFTTQYTLIHVFEAPRIHEEQLVKDLRKIDSGTYYVATFVCCQQMFLVQQKIPIANFYYSWRPTKTPSFNKHDDSGPNYDTLATIKPTYVIAPPNILLSRFGYMKITSYPHAIVWKTSAPTIFPDSL